MLAGMLLGSGPSYAASRRSTSSAVSSSHTLNLAWTFVDMSPDPATWYGVNNELETALYQGLLQYSPNTTHIVPNLATSYSISANGKSYTFNLRSGVKFHDGTAFNCAAAKFSFQREITIAGGPSYMLASVASMSCPSPMTFVVHLKTPTAGFLDYMCSAYGPKMLSPTAVAAHMGTKKDFGQAWLAAHDAGTGPYTLVKNNSVGLQLKAFPQYWGPKPYFTTINIAIIPSSSTEILELESGQLNFLADAVPTSQLSQLAANSRLSIHYYPAIFKLMFYVNPHKGIFTNSTLRKALKYAINPAAITAAAYGPAGKASTQFNPVDELPPGTGLDKWTYDPSKVKAILNHMTDKSVTIQYTTSIEPDALAADELQVELAAAGFNAKVVGITNAEFVGMPAHQSQAADILISTINPDTANPDNYFRIYMYKGGVLNDMDAVIPAADKLVDEASVSLSSATRYKDWEQAAELYAASGDWIPVTDPQGYLIIQKNIVKIQHSVLDPFGAELGGLAP